MRLIASILGIGAMAASLPAYAQVVISSQAAGISSASGTITAARVPVQNGTNPVQYFDVTISLAPTFNGSNVSGLSASATSTPSKILQTQHFVAGTYKGADGSTYTVSGPGAGPGGGTVWTIVENSGGTSCLAQATWYTTAGKDNPEYARLKAAGITSPTYSYGVEGTASTACNFDAATFGTDTLIGAYQSGNALVISSFTYEGHGDSKTPVDSLEMNLQ